MAHRSKEAKKEADRKYYQRNREKVRQQQRENYYRKRAEILEQQRRYYHDTKDARKESLREQGKKWRERNPDYMRTYYRENKDKWGLSGERKKRKERMNKEWRASNRERIKQYNKENADRRMSWQRSKQANDPKFRIDRTMGANIQKSAKGKGGKTWEEFVDFTKEELRMHLEALFHDGMSWSNFGEWHIDHVIPKSWFNYETVDDPVFRIAWSLYNLQPMWAEQNLKKRDCFIGRAE